MTFLKKRNDDALILFTACYPYGNKSETFLESEIKSLSRYFDTVYLIPSNKEKDVIRPVPANVIVLNFLIDLKIERKWIIKKYWWTIFRIYFWTTAQKGNFQNYFQNYKTYLGLLIDSFGKYDEIVKFIQKRHTNSIYYDYWFVNSTLALCIAKAKGQIKYLTTRAHGFDLYDHRWNEGKVPFREYKLKYIERVYSVSEFGMEYLKDKVPQYENKIYRSYLGVPDQVEFPNKVTTTLFIVSCSSLIDFKRVHEIPRALMNLKRKAKWIHFGSGPSEEILNNNLHLLPSNIEFELRGHVNNADVISFYKNNYIDVFISLSLSEGLPVSIMEAISFGIPVIACDIPGMSEIVNKKTGLLIPSSLPLNQFPNFIEQLLDSKISRNEIIGFQKEFFSGPKNYDLFTSNLKISAHYC